MKLSKISFFAAIASLAFYGAAANAGEHSKMHKHDMRKQQVTVGGSFGREINKAGKAYPYKWYKKSPARFYLDPKTHEKKYFQIGDHDHKNMEK